ncbi:recombinase family protein [Rhodobacteraceae bacterium]|nr:recombinase family protein [Paracoccaceae bacterium]
MMMIGFARVSTTNQKLDRQIGVPRSENCDTIFCEKASAKSIKGRSELAKFTSE